MSAPWDSVEQAAQEYVSLMLDTAPNGWGQHVHPVHGRSDNMLWNIQKQFGDILTSAALDCEFERRKAMKGGAK